MTTDMSKFTDEYLFGEIPPYEEAVKQEVFTIDDSMFARLDEMFGIVPGTDRLIEEEVVGESK